MMYGLFDFEGDAVDDLFGYVDTDAANDALGEYEHGGRATYDGVHVGELCACTATPHEFDVDCGSWV